MRALEKVAAKTGISVEEVTTRTAAMVKAGLIRITCDVDGRATYGLTDTGKDRAVSAKVLKRIEPIVEDMRGGRGAKFLADMEAFARRWVYMCPRDKEIVTASRPSRSLQALYDKWNQVYWGGRLARYDVRVFSGAVARSQRCGGLHLDLERERWESRSVDRSVDLCGLIFVAEFNGDRERRGTMLHEMVHASGIDGHGPEFLQELERVRAMGHPHADDAINHFRLHDGAANPPSVFDAYWSREEAAS